MPRKPIVAVVGSGAKDKTNDPTFKRAISDAHTLGTLLAKQGFVIASGGRDAGVMAAVNNGAKAVPGSLTIGILPKADSNVSQNVDVALYTDMNNARNNLVGLSACVVVACGVDGPGTASELALALKNGKPIILLNARREAIDFFKSIGDEKVFVAASPQDVIKIILDNKFC